MRQFWAGSDKEHAEGLGGGDFHFLHWALVQAKKGVVWTLIASSALWQAEQPLILYTCCWQRPLPWAAEPPTRRGPRSHQHDGSQHHGCPSGRPSVSPTSARDFRGCLGTAWGASRTTAFSFVVVGACLVLVVEFRQRVLHGWPHPEAYGHLVHHQQYRAVKPKASLVVLLQVVHTHLQP